MACDFHQARTGYDLAQARIGFGRGKDARPDIPGGEESQPRPSLSIRLGQCENSERQGERARQQTEPHQSPLPGARSAIRPRRSGRLNH